MSQGFLSSSPQLSAKPASCSSFPVLTRYLKLDRAMLARIAKASDILEKNQKRARKTLDNR